MARQEADTAVNIYDLDSNDPDSRLVFRGDLGDYDIQQIGRLLGAMGALREAENRLSERNQRDMKLNATDLKALHYLIAMRNRNEQTTPGMLTSHLGISSASTTKLLDRLEHAGHLIRQSHPEDRRGRIVEITERAHEEALNTVGRHHAKRFRVIAAMSDSERETVIRFLTDMAVAINQDD